MKKLYKSLSVLTLVMTASASFAGIRDDFANPPESTRLQMWCHWVGDCVTREGLTRDFKAFGELGVGMVHIISPSMANLPQTARTMSPEWLDLFTFAIGEAAKNGVKISFHNCPGWSSSGGPWVKPEDSMKIVVASETDADPTRDSRVKLPQPMTICNFYRDVAVYAFPLETPAFKGLTRPVVVPIKADNSKHSISFESPSPISPTRLVLSFAETSFRADGIVEASADGKAWSKVADFKFRFFRAPATPKVVSLAATPKAVRFFRIHFMHVPPLPWVPARDLTLNQAEFNDVPMIVGVEDMNSATSRYGFHPELAKIGKGIDPTKIVNLTASLADDGTVDLAALPRNRQSYRILRIGYTSKGVKPAPSTIGGLECDKLDRRGIDAHWAGMPAKILALPGAKETVKAMYIDSYEVGGQNWSERLPDEFRKRRGYEIGANLLTVYGYPVGDGASAAKFLWDFQRTIGELFCENYYDRYGELCREAGIVSIVQAYGGPFDSVRAAKNCAEPQGEYWMSADEYRESARLMASVCHLYGKPFASAESFTSERAEGRWLANPHWFRVIGDHSGWLEGINRIVCHSYCHQPFTNVTPGISLGRHGSHFSVNSTWWKDGVHWHDYVRRGQALLQFGRPCAEVLVLGRSGQFKLLDAGYNFDFCGEAEVAQLEARAGKFGMPGQHDYAVLVVDPAIVPRLSDATRAKLKALETAGVPVAYGDALAAVRKVGLQTPFECAGGAVRAIRREGDNGETVWFVANMRKERFVGKATMQAKPGTRPELFDAKTGEISALECESVGKDRFAVKLELEPEGSAFVVFTADARPFVAKRETTDKPIDISGGWKVTSFEGRNAPAAPLAMDRLTAWNDADDPKLKYFSGRAVYEKTVKIPALALDGGRALILDLGEVHEIANVWVNGKFVACLWEAPYRVTVPSSFLGQRPASMALRIEVVNLLPNRMIGDAIAIRDGAKEEMNASRQWPKWVLENRQDSGTGIFTWSNFRQAWSADDQPLRSGLLGPVTIRRSDK